MAGTYSDRRWSGAGNRTAGVYAVLAFRARGSIAVLRYGHGVFPPDPRLWIGLSGRALLALDASLPAPEGGHVPAAVVDSDHCALSAAGRSIPTAFAGWSARQQTEH